MQNVPLESFLDSRYVINSTQDWERAGVVSDSEAKRLISSGETADTRPHICHFLLTRRQLPEGPVANTAKFLINLSFL